MLGTGKLRSKPLLAFHAARNRQPWRIASTNSKKSILNDGKQPWKLEARAGRFVVDLQLEEMEITPVDVALHFCVRVRPRAV